VKEGNYMQPDSSPVKVRNAAQAIEAVLSYLRKQQVTEFPNKDIKWQEKTIYSTESMDYAITSKLYTSDDWLIEVFQGVAPVSRTVYQITVFNSRLRCYWQGSVTANGGISGDNAYRLLSEEESQKLAEDFLRKSQVPPPRPGGYGH
jgi:hypothetical protein